MVMIKLESDSMDELFDCPEKEIWERRRTWVYDELEKAEVGGHSVSDHSIALFMDMQKAFCTGAWISVIVMSISVIDAHLRETEADNNLIGTAKLLQEFYEGEGIDWLRKLRNRYVHHNLEKPFLEMNCWFNNQTSLEKDAYKAMKMTISALFQNPFI